MSLIDPHLAELLICPLCHGELDSEEPASQLRCRACGRTYPVRDFPIMMPEAVAEVTPEVIADAEQIKSS
jgi:uncharacterized protein YbaR (Trm112 family)